MRSIKAIFAYKDNVEFNAKRNSIGLLRLVLALAVLYAHAFELGGFGHDIAYKLSGNLYSFGAIAVDGFFALSGYLITSSYLRLKSLPRFLWHRMLRLFPAYWIYLIVVGVGFAPFLGGIPSLDYIEHNLLVPARLVCMLSIGTWLTLFWGWLPNLEHVQHKFLFTQGGDVILPLLAQNPIPNVVNGSLWTLEAEFRVYVIVGLLGLLGMLRKNFTSCLLLLVWVGYVLYFYHHPDLSTVASIRLPAHFLGGIAFYFWKPPLNRTLALSALTAAAIALGMGFYPLVSPLTTTYLLFWLAAVLPFSNIGRMRDYSYGLYIYGFVVQQALSAYGFNRWGFTVYLILSIVCTLVFAATSWHLIEKPAMKWKDVFSRKAQHA